MHSHPQTINFNPLFPDCSLSHLISFQFNFVGKLLGPKGNSLKRLQEETMCKMAVLGKGSMRDRKKVRIHTQTVALHPIHISFSLNRPFMHPPRRRNCDSVATRDTHIFPRTCTSRFPPTQRRPRRTPASPTPWPRFDASWYR